MGFEELRRIHLHSDLDLQSGEDIRIYSGRKITESLRNVTVRGEKGWKEQGGSKMAKSCLSMYSITENIYY
jgi:hypothetical protein